MPLVRVRILHGKTQLAAPSRPFAADATLHYVVGKALEPFAEYAVNVSSSKSFRLRTRRR